jgi:hypothetical protein
MHVMVCGGRKHFLTPEEMDWLEYLRRSLLMTVLIPGGGTFVDAALTAWAYQAGVRVEPIPADWTGTYAHGPHRSLAYLKLLRTWLPPGSLRLLALPGGEGTAYLRTGALRLGLPVLTYPDKEILMPEMTVTPPDDSPVPHLGDADVPDDIPDPPVLDSRTAALDAPSAAAHAPNPPGAPEPVWQQHEALLHGFLTHLLQRLNSELFADSREIMKTVDAVLKLVEASAARQDRDTSQAWSQLVGVLEQGIALRHDPYEAHVKSVSPEGFVIDITLKKADAGGLVQAMTGLTQWLIEHHYKPL